MACACAIGLWPGVALPEDKEVPLAPPRKETGPVNFDPADVYFQGWLLSRDAEKLQAEKKYAEALEKLERSRELIDSVATYFPMWRREMVSGRRIQTKESIDAVGPLALKEKQAELREVATLEGGVLKGAPAKPLGNGNGGGIAPAPMPPVREVESLETRRIAELEKRVEELQGELSNKTIPTPDGTSRDADRARDIAKQRDMARAELKRAQDEMAQLRAKFAAAPMQEEMQKLADKIGGLEREKAAMGQALGKSQDETRSAKADVAALQGERTRLMQESSDLNRNLDSERKTSNEVIAGQQKQLREYQEQLRGTQAKLDGANLRITKLEGELNSLHQSVNDLKVEKDNLMRERDQMAQLLQHDEGNRIKTLIDQNMGLAKDLREAQDKLKHIDQENNANLDAWTEAMRDLSIAKQNINDLKRERLAQDQRLDELQKRLQNEDQALAEGKGADPAEVEYLRSIIQKQLRIQERRREASEILVDALGEKAKGDAKIDEALKLLDGAELPLTAEELSLAQPRKVDDQFVSPVPRTQGEVDVNLARLEQENLPITDAAKRAFLNKRYESSRELYEMALERNAGDTETRCKLGVVQLRLNDAPMAAETFRRAAELNTNNPYAYRMLGVALRETGDLGEAIKAAEESVKLAPTNADGRVLLGSIYFDVGQEAEAEEQFKSAIAYDDTMPFAHLNLAHLYAKQGKKKQGLEYYRNALARNAKPDMDLEQRLGSK